MASRQRWRAAFAIAQVACVSVLLVGATLIMASFIRVTTADLGFNRFDVLVVSPDGVPKAVRPDVLHIVAREIEPDVNLDLGEDGQPVGYDVQHASTKRDFIMSVIFANEPQTVAE